MVYQNEFQRYLMIAKNIKGLLCGIWMFPIIYQFWVNQFSPEMLINAIIISVIIELIQVIFLYAEAAKFNATVFHGNGYGGIIGMVARFLETLWNDAEYTASLKPIFKELQFLKTFMIVEIFVLAIQTFYYAW